MIGKRCEPGRLEDKVVSARDVGADSQEASIGSARGNILFSPECLPWGHGGGGGCMLGPRKFEPRLIHLIDSTQGLYHWSTTKRPLEKNRKNAKHLVESGFGGKRGLYRSPTLSVPPALWFSQPVYLKFEPCKSFQNLVNQRFDSLVFGILSH